MRFKHMLLAATAASLLPVAPALAQDDRPGAEAGDIIVTARKRQESILKVPVVANVLSSETLQQSAVVDLQGVATKVPGLFVSPGVNTIGTLISLRGVGTSALDVGVDQSVSLNIDGQQFSQGLTFKSGMFDLAQAEVLKGPQALFFGKNSPAGVIALTTADPGDELEIIGRVGYEFEAKEPRTELIVSGPLSDTLGLRLAGSWSDREGYFKNTAGVTAIPALGGRAPSRKRSDSNENWIFRATAVWKPNDDFSAKLKVNFTRDHSDAPNPVQFASCLSGTGPGVGGIQFIGGANPCRLDDETEVVDFVPAAHPGVPNNGSPFLTIRQKFGVLSLDQKLTDEITASSVTTYYKNVTDGMINGIYSGAVGSLWADNHFTRRDFTEEVRIESDYADKPLNWLIGGYYQNAKVTNDITLGWNQSINPLISAFTQANFGFPLALPPIIGRGTHDMRIKSYSLFGQLRWEPVDTVEIAAGVRWNNEKRSNTPTNFGSIVPIPKPKIKAKNWSPELTITYSPTDNLTIFGALKQGYKSGSYQLITPNPANEDRSFGDEKVQGGEVGVKMRSADRAFNVNAAFYYYRFEGLQIGVSQPGNAGGIPITLTKNAGKSRTYGIDLDATYSPPSIDGLFLHLSVNWNKAKFLELDGLPCYGGQTIALGCNQVLNPATGAFTARSESGTPLERAPVWQVIGGFDYDMQLNESLGLSFGGSAQHSSSYTSPIGSRSDFRQKGYTKLNAQIALKGKDNAWELALIGNNLNDVIRCGYCTNSDFKNTTVLTGFAQQTGRATNPSGKVDEAAGIAIPGRQVFIRLTIRPMGLFQ